MNTVLQSGTVQCQKNSKALSSHQSLENGITKAVESYFVFMNNHAAPENKFLLGQPRFYWTNTKVNMEVFYYMGNSKRDTNMSSRDINYHSIMIIAEMFAKDFDKEVSISFTRIHYPYINANIFAKYLFYNSKGYRFIAFKNAILKYPRYFSQDNTFFQSDLSCFGLNGIKIQVSGRIATEKVIPRVTTKSVVVGSLSKSSFVDFGSYTGKNYLGSFTIKVWLGMKLFTTFPYFINYKSNVT